MRYMLYPMLPGMAALMAGGGALLTGPALAAGPGSVVITPLLLEGDAVDGVGLITRIDNIAVNDSGLWLVEADTDHPDLDATTQIYANRRRETKDSASHQVPI